MYATCKLCDIAPRKYKREMGTLFKPNRYKLSQVQNADAWNAFLLFTGAVAVLLPAITTVSRTVTPASCAYFIAEIVWLVVVIKRFIICRPEPIVYLYGFEVF